MLGQHCWRVFESSAIAVIQTDRQAPPDGCPKLGFLPILNGDQIVAAALLCPSPCRFALSALHHKIEPSAAIMQPPGIDLNKLPRTAGPPPLVNSPIPPSTHMHCPHCTRSMRIRQDSNAAPQLQSNAVFATPEWRITSVLGASSVSASSHCPPHPPTPTPVPLLTPSNCQYTSA
jgi:hypothetical protein